MSEFVNSWDWQLPAAIACVAWAVIVMLRRFVEFFAANGVEGCHRGCTGCSMSPFGLKPESDDFVSLESLVQSISVTSTGPSSHM